ncbi:hypothetical protein I0C86_41150 [Plantactinospora sp. S1510]|uniref:Uncharacterized protein n=1 Tax=Plantactinospora alkalitolerans TaxID=2789879 RepID=A0ABS0H9V7_9ACTN|nr:hypothetical protein [Plantactinospora alkalitolerans]MBF9135260.1 hypothetical protein [Plantactinospora alkalitolerans]
MVYVIVEDVTDPVAAASALREGGELLRAIGVEKLGKGAYERTDAYVPRGGNRADGLRALEQFRAEHAVPGLMYYLRTDFDPDWSKQDEAARAALAEVRMPRERCGIRAVNAFKRAYYTWGPEWDTPDPCGGRWAAHHARNFRDGALVLGNALAGLCRSDGDMAPMVEMKIVASLGWDGEEVGPEARIRDEAWVALSLGRILRECGDGRIGDLLEAIEAGYDGHN